MEKYDKKFYDYLVLNQNNSEDTFDDVHDNSSFKELHLINASEQDAINKRSNNFIWMFFYFFILIILIIMVFLFV